MRGQVSMRDLVLSKIKRDQPWPIDLRIFQIFYVHIAIDHFARKLVNDILSIAKKQQRQKFKIKFNQQDSHQILQI
jgi:hypothetical protein